MSSSRPEREEDLHAELGYRTAGQREVAVREWFTLRGEKDEPLPTPKAFERKIAVLRAVKWQRENPERRREIANRYARKPEKKALALALAKKRRQEKQHKEAVVFVCRECNVEFCKAPWTKGPPPNFCRNACYAVNKYHRDYPSARRNKPTKRVYVRGSRRAS